MILTTELLLMAVKPLCKVKQSVDYGQLTNHAGLINEYDERRGKVKKTAQALFFSFLSFVFFIVLLSCKTHLLLLNPLQLKVCPRRQTLIIDYLYQDAS